MENGKRQKRYRRVDCYRCGDEMERAYVKPPALCAGCKDDRRFYERHPENADPVVWRVPKYDPNPGDKYAPKAEQAEQRTFADAARDALIREREGIGAELHMLAARRQTFVDQRDTAEDRIVEIDQRVAGYRGKLEDIEFELNRI